MATAKTEDAKSNESVDNTNESVYSLTEILSRLAYRVHWPSESDRNKLLDSIAALDKS